MCEICSKLTIKLPQRRQCRSYVFNIYFEQISHCSNAFIVDSEQVNAVWNSFQKQQQFTRIVQHDYFGKVHKFSRKTLNNFKFTLF